MTREEYLKYGFEIGLLEFSEYLELTKPLKLPEGPDEAALLAASEYPSDEYPKVIDPEGGEHEMYDFTALMDMFKAGAKWQAEQGESFEFVIQYGFGVSDTSTDTKHCTLTFPLPANIVEGDKLIVQIRKII